MLFFLGIKMDFIQTSDVFWRAGQFLKYIIHNSRSWSERRKVHYFAMVNILVRRNRLSGREETVCPVEWKP